MANDSPIATASWLLALLSKLRTSSPNTPCLNVNGVSWAFAHRLANPKIAMMKYLLMFLNHEI